MLQVNYQPMQGLPTGCQLVNNLVSERLYLTENEFLDPLKLLDTTLHPHLRDFQIQTHTLASLPFRFEKPWLLSLSQISKS